MNKDGLRDFIKYAYSTGRVKDVKEAFNEYPPEEEWHEGKIENVLFEPDEKYQSYNVGDIIFVKNYYYPDGKKGKNHLFVIIDINCIAVPIEIFGMLISSKLEKEKYASNKYLAKDDKNGLKQDSIVKTDVIYKIKDEQILFKIGNVEKSKIEEYKQVFLDKYR